MPSDIVLSFSVIVAVLGALSAFTNLMIAIIFLMAASRFREGTKKDRD